MSIRRQEIFKELRLTPFWHHKDNRVISSIKQASRSITETADRRYQILHSDWAQLKENVVSCTSCPLCQDRTKAVFGTGDEHANWLFVGEAPGMEEDIQGEPFVGSAGKLLNNMLEAINLSRSKNLYITNIVKCRPPGNRNPEFTEMSNCEPFLTRQIELIRPKLIIALGRIAAQNLLNTNATIASLRGKLHKHSGIPLIVTYHPAYLLRKPHDKAKVWEDLCFVRNIMQKVEKNF